MSHRVPILNLRAQYEQIGQRLEQSVLEVLRSGSYILSENVSIIEKEVAKLCGAAHGIGVANGTDALILSLWCMDIGPGDEVITSPFTFAATVEAIALRGGKPVFVDIDPLTFNIDPAKIRQAITSKTKAIMPVHLYGLPADMEPIMAIAKQFGLRVIEDNAQAIGALYKGNPTGSFGDVASISFYPTKNLGAAGDAGMIVTNDEQLANRIRSLRAHGMTRRYYHDELGVNSRLDELQAAILSAKLPYLEEWTQRRNEIASRYNTNLKGCPGITLPAVAFAGLAFGNGVPQAPETTEITHVWHQYTIRVQSPTLAQGQSPTFSQSHSSALSQTSFSPDQATTSSQDSTNENRERLIKELNERGIGSMCYYPVPLHLQTAFSDLGHSRGDFPLAERAANEVLSLPMYPELTDQQVDLVCFAVKDAMSKITVSARSSVAVHNTFPGI